MLLNLLNMFSLKEVTNDNDSITMPRDNKESGGFFLGLGLGGYGIYLVLYFGNNWIVCRFMVFNILMRNGVNR